MVKRATIALVAAFLLAASACGREGVSESQLATETSATPAATATAARATPTASAAPAAVASPAPGAQAGPGTGAGAVPAPANQGGVNTPKDGRYVYAYEGEATNPFNPAGGRERFKGELTKEISHEGNVYTSEETTSEEPGRVTTRSRWEPDRILLLSIKIETAGGDFSCTFDPPLLIAKIPIKVETFPTQNFKGKGNACNGTLDISVIAKETAKDAQGRSWSTWRARIRTNVKTDQFSNSSDQMQWFSPDLGVEIRVDGSFKGTFGAQQFEGKDSAVLKSRP